ncbi:MAG: hypothetical protein DRI01_09545 [Chloroflexi bacterium]|nr:MAG: hypothetical protein DRI01_09545 [Chloroflexota bacterium]
MAKKQLTEFTMHCLCGAAAPIFKLQGGRFMGHCPGCGALVFFSNPVLLERLRHGGDLCPHQPERRPCRGGFTTWCPTCRVRCFYYDNSSNE